MPSLLTNSRMPPALRARVLQSLNSDARSRAGGERDFSGSRLVRLLVALGVVALTVALVFTYRRSRADFEIEKKALIAEYSQQTGQLDASFRRRLERIDQFMKTAHEPYRGDHIASSWRGNLARLDEALRGPLAYVR